MPSDTSEHSSKVREYFDARVADYDAFYEPDSALRRWFNRVFRKAVYARRDQVLTLAQRHDCKTVLDVGCGSGRNGVWWTRNGIERVHGVDISAEMIEEARTIASDAGVADRCTFEHVDFMESRDARTYDIVAACGVFDYVVDATAFLRRMAAQADKVVYGSFPGWTLVRSPLRKVRYALRGCPTHFYRLGELHRTFESVGFGAMEFKCVPSGRLVWAVRTPG